MPRKKIFNSIEEFAIRRMWVCFPTFSAEDIAAMFDCSAKTITQIVRGVARSNSLDTTKLLHDLYRAYRRDMEELGETPKDFQAALREAQSITSRFALRLGSQLSTVSGVPQ